MSVKTEWEMACPNCGSDEATQAEEVIMKRYITLPNGHACSLPTYCKAWRTLKTAKPGEEIKGWDHFPTEAGSILRDIRLGIHDRINRHIPGYGKGRKWRETWQWDMIRIAHCLNTPRLIIHWLPKDIKERFAHRLWNRGDF